MEKKKFMNGTEFGSKSEHATKSSSAPDGAATGFVPLDDGEFATVTGGHMIHSAYIPYFNPCVCLELCGIVFPLKFESYKDATVALRALSKFVHKRPTADSVLAALSSAGVTAKNEAFFVKVWKEGW